MRSIFIALIFFLLCRQLLASGNPARNEINRFFLNNDKIYLEREIFLQNDNSILNLSTYASTGVISTFSEITSISSSENQIVKTLKLIELLNKNINSEKQVNVDFKLGIPLPPFKIKSVIITPALFDTLNYGLHLSFNNQEDVTNPTAQVYLKHDTKTGILFSVIWDKWHTFKFKLYEFERTDHYQNIVSSQIAQQEQVFSLENLQFKQKTYALDLNFIQKFSSIPRLEIEYNLHEIKLKTLKDSTISTYGHRIFFNTKVNWRGTNPQLKYFYGIHLRKKYQFTDGIYLGASYLFETPIPVSLSAKIDSSLISFMPQIKWKYLHFSYHFITPYQNPIGNIWSPSIHSINLNITL